MPDNASGYVWLEDAVEHGLDALHGVDGFENLFPHLDRLVSKTLEAAALRFDSASEELDRVATLTSLHADVDTALTDHIRLCRELLGYSWTDVSKQLGVSRQAARQRFGAEVDGETPETDRLDAEAEYLLAKMKLSAKEHAMEHPGQAASVTIDAADWERLLEIERERRTITQAALESLSAQQVDEKLTRKAPK